MNFLNLYDKSRPKNSQNQLIDKRMKNFSQSMHLSVICFFATGTREKGKSLDSNKNAHTSFQNIKKVISKYLFSEI